MEGMRNGEEINNKESKRGLECACVCGHELTKVGFLSLNSLKFFNIKMVHVFNESKRGGALQFCQPPKKDVETRTK